MIHDSEYLSSSPKPKSKTNKYLHPTSHLCENRIRLYVVLDLGFRTSKPTALLARVTFQNVIVYGDLTPVLGLVIRARG